jgi:hypothetical protein
VEISFSRFWENRLLASVTLGKPLPPLRVRERASRQKRAGRIGDVRSMLSAGLTKKPCLVVWREKKVKDLSLTGLCTELRHWSVFTQRNALGPRELEAGGLMSQRLARSKKPRVDSATCGGGRGSHSSGY